MKTDDVKFNNVDWPDEYPYRLRKVSWRLEGKDGVVCGVLPWYNRHLDYSVKGDACFVKQVLLDWFWNNGCGAEVCDDICQYFCECFSVYYIEGEDEFRIGQKKDKDNKVIFDQEKFRRLWAANADMKDVKAMLKKMLNYVHKFYNSIMKAHIDNVNSNKRG